MTDHLKDILSHLSKEIDQETLIKYINGQLSEEQKHEVEKLMIDNEFTNEAIEGLQQLGKKENISSIIDQLNLDLKKKLSKKKQRREKLKFKDKPWIYIAVIVVLLLIVLAYFVIYKMMQQS